ncbi:MAG: putative bifunctional diguanylate cyclase/phosphodiesterase [Gemmatimonadota bacterium]
MTESVVKGPIRLLLVEDSPMDEALLVRHLERGGLNIGLLRVETAEEMRTALADREWDLVISDYNLPEFDARQALGVLNASGIDLPFIVVSGDVGEEIAVGMMREGAHDYILKDRLFRLVPAIERELRKAEERRRTAEKLHYLAHYDVLTDLPNRVLLQERMTQAISLAQRYGDTMAVLFLDLDRFKHVNDSLGHQLGDDLLKSVARRLAHRTRACDTVARLGGDEFVICLSRVTLEGTTRVAESLLRALNEPHQVGRHVINISASIGVSVFPDDGQDATTLVKHADAALYHAKSRGRDNFQFFTSELNRRALQFVSIEAALRQAVEREEFRVVYQPRVDIRTNAIVGAEALLRWSPPTLGNISPDVFVRVAEDTGMIVQIGEWVLRQACAQSARWRAAGLPPISIAVNVSALQFKHRGFLETVKRALADTATPPDLLELELTEGSVMDDVDASAETMRELDQLGVLISIDDFGTGHSSLAYLKKFPLTYLKIDKTFVLGCPHSDEDSAIVRAVISLAHSLRLAVIAEGVERIEQVDFLQSHDCGICQGYLFSAPVPPAELERLLAAGVVTPVEGIPSSTAQIRMAGATSAQ